MRGDIKIMVRILKNHTKVIDTCDIHLPTGRHFKPAMKSIELCTKCGSYDKSTGNVKTSDSDDFCNIGQEASDQRYKYVFSSVFPDKETMEIAMRAIKEGVKN